MMYDENYGQWHDTDDEETRDFYKYTARNSVTKRCSICGRMVKIMPQYDKCNSCCERMERGMEW
jgi:hypothetical protein